MGSIPNGSAPLHACARQISKITLPSRTGKAQVHCIIMIHSQISRELLQDTWQPFKTQQPAPPAGKHAQRGLWAWVCLHVLEGLLV